MSEKHFDRPQPGWKMITPGVYVDSDENMHFFAEIMLAANHIADTPENHVMLEKAFVEQFTKIYPKAIITMTSDKGGK